MKYSILLVIALVYLLTAACTSQMGTSTPAQNTMVQFSEVTESVGINSHATWKYGGPSVADLNNDGRYDLILSNHHVKPAQLFWGNAANSFTEHGTPIAAGDVHGIAAGDYDLDGDNDLLVSKGGGNGKQPKPPRLLRNDEGQFTDVTNTAGIAQLGARGRAVRWIDLDSDGDLDLLQINAGQILGETGPRNILFENTGDGQFLYRSSPDFEKIDAERVLITDFNGDHIPDLVAFTPLSLWQGNDNFTFTDLSANRLPKDFAGREHVMAAAEADIDNDGDLDLYLARGKTYYEIANNAVSFNSKTGRLDLRDEGNTGHDGISFSAAGDIKLHDFYHWPRGMDIILPVYLGANQILLDTPDKVAVHISPEQAKGFPKKIDENGWYLGYLGEGEWRLEWLLKDNLAWDLRASISGVSDVRPDWEPQDLRVPDILLRNDGDGFSDISNSLPVESLDNNWGVTAGDFDNDGLNDFFIYRFGELQQGVEDVLLLNKQARHFLAFTQHGANSPREGSHGDMGSAFDFDLDGKLDVLSGDDDAGRWHLYKNTTLNSHNNYVLVRVAYSARGTDPMGAEIEINTSAGKQIKRVGSAGAVHSQSLLNIAHFGLGAEKQINNIIVRWRDGTQQQASGLKVNQLHVFGK